MPTDSDRPVICYIPNHEQWWWKRYSQDESPPKTAEVYIFCADDGPQLFEEFKITWLYLGDHRECPRLSMFDEAWPALRDDRIKKLFLWMSEIQPASDVRGPMRNLARVTPEVFCAKLEELGIRRDEGTPSAEAVESAQGGVYRLMERLEEACADLERMKQQRRKQRRKQSPGEE